MLILLRKHIHIILALGFLFILPGLSTLTANDIITRLEFKQPPAFQGLSNDEVQKVFQDREGFMWFATRNGLCKFDGYEMTVFKSNLYTPDLFTNNNILCLADDADHNLWIGTFEGINIINKETGFIKKGTYAGIKDNTVSCLLVSSDNVVWLGTDIGLYRYNSEGDNMELISGEKTNNTLPACAIKSLFEDSEGDMWIGTWSNGLYRYSRSDKCFHQYPQINLRNSAHIIYEDSQKRIWIGGWAEGLFLLDNPKDMNRVSWVNYRHDENNSSSLSDNTVYEIYEDKNTQSLWIGTRSGLSIMNMDVPGKFINYKSRKSPYYIPYNEINSIKCDISGNIWLATIGRGVFMVNTQKPKFRKYEFQQDDANIPTSAVRSILVDTDDNVWLGVGTYGLARHNRKTNDYLFFSHIPEFSEIKSIPTVYSIMQRRDEEEIWFGTYDGGIFVYKKGEKVKHYKADNSDFVKHICVTALYEDKQGNCWVGTRNGIGVRRSDNTGYLLKNMMVDGHNLEWGNIRNIMQDSCGDIWLATANLGVIRISGDVYNPHTLKYFNYNLVNGKMPAKSISCIYEDSQGRLWVGTEGNGLFLYNNEADNFEEKNRLYNLPGDMVGSIQEDGQGSLWLGTNKGLARINVNGNASEAFVRIYTAADGLQDNYFIPLASFNKGGELFFAGYKGYNSFFPDNIENTAREVLFQITDIKIFNQSFTSLDEQLRKRISSKTPVFTQKVELPYKYNNFNIEFAALTYKNPELNKYAYKLEGFDKDWHYTDANRRFAYYNNMKSGTYLFLLKAADENGVWSEQMRKISVTVLPPFWATWWAYCIYVILIVVSIYTAIRITNNRMMLKNSLRLQKMEQAKAEELNHTKLQFFTNITHELLTPLTIISATVDELRLQAPQYTNIYSVLNVNIQRLIRLLQQILEFRKAETGNLKLKVSSGNLSAFVKNETEAFVPLIKKRKLHFSFTCNPVDIIGYFDNDKLDKIIYNLLSNAAKYNKEGGFIQLNVSYADNKDYALITVKDNGKGISKENQKDLFKRFYEGDYRRFNTIGTGIGLSLTKDLVKLHRGEISVESEVNKGSVFSVIIPIERSYYRDEEIDENIVYIQKESVMPEAEQESLEKMNTTHRHSVLVVEDNEELLQLMYRLLIREYNVFKAGNGKEAIEIIENEEIDLIVSDIMMPQMDGIELCQFVKGKLEYSHIPIILLTAKNKEEDRAEAYESGADGFISKPFNLTVLHARIKNLLKYKERMARDFKNQLVFEAKDLNYTTLDEEFMQKAIECVNRHLDDSEFDQSQFIEEMSTSKSTLYKKLKSLTGLNTSAFIRNIRLKAACRIMEEKKGVRISELAYAVGFNDPKYFSSCFKKEFHMLPSEYMERFISYEEENNGEV